MRTIRVDMHAELGVFEGWGTSLAWWANTVGRWPRAERTTVVRRLFGLTDGGLGLTVARFNAGGGENPGVAATMLPRAAMDGYRPAPDADFDETADPGQRAVLRDAARVVAEEGGKLVVEVFGNSPPWWATVSGSVTGATDGEGLPAPNLDPVFARDYLRYLSDVAAFVERDAEVRVTSLSPFNEPTSRWWVYGGRQEGCHFTRDGIDRLLTELSELPQVLEGRTIAASEEWSLEQALCTWDRLGPTARRIVGRLNTHTYYGDARCAVRARAAREGAGLWASEYGDGGPCGREMALAIVRDLRELAPSAWVLWQAVSPDAWGLMRLGRDAGDVMATPKFEVFARFTRTIRPGMILVGTDDPLSVAASGSGRFSAVVVGDAKSDEVVCIDLGTGPEGAGICTAEVTITSASCGNSATVQMVDARGGELTFDMPAGCVASITVAVTVNADDGCFHGSGTWWIEHESGARLGLAADGDDELSAGVRVAVAVPDDNALAQRWRAEACGDGSVRWVCEASGQQLDIERASVRAGAHAIQWPAGRAEETPDHNRFELVDAGDGAFRLIARHSGMALALDRAGLGIQRPAGDARARWRLARVRIRE